MIRLGLERIKLLLEGVHLPWRAIHVAGTNGKGSVCAYLDAMLRHANVRTGRFTSPHLIDRWDCIRINEKPVAESVFRQAEQNVLKRNEENSIQASSFEILTATAFIIFKQEQIDVGVVECGMGGRTDATNVLENPLLTVITSIGLDHEAFLGNTVEAIAREKAGIMKYGAPCVTEATNDDKVIQALKEVAADVNVDLHVHSLPDTIDWQKRTSNANIRELAKPFKAVQTRNQWLAYQAMALALPRLGLAEYDIKSLAYAMAEVQTPGRFQRVDLAPLTGRNAPVLLDGAHNEQAMQAILQYRRTMSNVLSSNTAESSDAPERPCTWLIACSSTKGDLFCIPPQDHVVITEFGPVDGMPWVMPKSVDDILSDRSQTEPNAFTIRNPSVSAALKRACEIAEEGPMIIAGSLYLASDVLRLLRDAESGL